MAKKLENKVAIVTGASKGIGASIAKSLASEGAAVVVNYSSSKEAADHVVADIVKKGGKALAIQADISNHTDIKKLFKEAKDAFGRLDILVNNAGIYEALPLEHITKEHFNKHFDLNVLGLILATQEAVHYFGSSGGSVINISSKASTAAIANFSVYSATKAAVDAITRSLSTELGSKKIRVNSINPGVIVTEGLRATGFTNSDLVKDFEARTPLGRLGEPEDIAPAVIFFASDESSWITGESLGIAGGNRSL